MIELIPAIDLIDGKCVRLTKGDYATQKTYNEDPVAVAREFESYGFILCGRWERRNPRRGPRRGTIQTYRQP